MKELLVAFGRAALVAGLVVVAGCSSATTFSSDLSDIAFDGSAHAFIRQNCQGECSTKYHLVVSETDLTTANPQSGKAAIEFELRSVTPGVYPLDSDADNRVDVRATVFDSTCKEKKIAALVLRERLGSRTITLDEVDYEPSGGGYRVKRVKGSFELLLASGTGMRGTFDAAAAVVFPATGCDHVQ